MMPSRSSESSFHTTADDNVSIRSTRSDGSSGSYYSLTSKTSIESSSQTPSKRTSVSAERFMTREERELLVQLRSAVSKQLERAPDYDTDFNLLRWLRGYEYKLDTILPLIKETVAFRNSLKLHEIDYSTIPNLHSYLSKRFSPPLVDYFPGGIEGTDKEGNIICIIPSGHFDIRGFFYSVRASEYAMRCVVLTEGLMSLVRAQERKVGHLCGVVYICDLDGFSLKEQMWMPPFPVTSFMMTMLQNHFPEVVHKMLIIKAPSSIQVAYKMMSPFLTKSLRDKIEFISGDWKTRLLELVDADQLPKFWGGTRTADNGDIYAGVKPSVKIPSRFYYNPKSSPIEPASSQLNTLSVGRASNANVKFECHTKGRSLKWFFRMSAGDISFGIYFLPFGLPDSSENRTTILPEFKLITDFVPEWGEILCEQKGVYLFEFNNKHSILRSKRVFYQLKMY